MSVILPDEIVSEILSPALKVSDELFSDTSDVSPFADYSPSTSAYLLVCKDWLRVATPLLYNVVVLRSKAQANALEKVLRSSPAFGRFIKKLRVEGGYGMAMHTILQSAPNITDLFISLTIWSSDGTQGLCKGLSLINPDRVITVDPQQRSKTLKNKHLSALLKVLFSCIRAWDNLKVFGFPYCYRTEQSSDLAHALSESHTIHTIVLPNDFYDSRPEFYEPFLTMVSLRAFQFRKPLTRYVREYVILPAINSQPRLKEMMRYTVVDTQSETENTSLVPDIAPSLNPCFIAMEFASDETREFVWKHVLSFAMYVEELRSPSFPRKPSKSYPSRLPILWLGQRLEDHPDLGSFIKCMFIEAYGGLQETAILPILSRATNLQKISGIGTIPPIITANVFNVLARTSGSSLHEFSNYFRGHSTVSILPSLHTLRLSGYFRNHDLPAVNKLLNAHKDNIIHLSIDYIPMEALKIYDICKNLVDCEFNMAYDIANLTCEMPHQSLVTIFTANLNGDPETIDLAMFPALRKIQIRSRDWPTTEREISKSDLVRMAEALMKKNITLLDSTGKSWIPRMKSIRTKR
ncbi:hypothetical protein B0H17DRAFT_1141381 [Mycena rosella]|uniref:Uncharacterized protein n=1 Tax=Mycena rosella TaxID=1033263 RepID=A0AAD7CZM8_MYCRO|nr:hypothetical protein B0H17DRAFT_1141381 [Mycena rosella]